MESLIWIRHRCVPVGVRLNLSALLTRLPESLHVLRRRNFRLLFAGQTVSVLGDRMVSVALAFAVLHIGGSASEVGLVLAAQVLPSAVTALVGGVLADRISRRTVMVGADLARVASQGTMAALLIAGSAEVWMLAALAAVGGAASGFFGPASLGLLPEVVPPEQLQPANALRASGASAGEILGPLSRRGAGRGGGRGLGDRRRRGDLRGERRLPPGAAAASSTRGERRSFLTDMREGWTVFSSRTWVWTLVAYFAIANILLGRLRTRSGRSSPTGISAAPRPGGRSSP